MSTLYWPGSLSIGPVSPGTAAPNSELIGGQYSLVLPTLTDGQQSAIQIDNRGRILISPDSGPVPITGTIVVTNVDQSANVNYFNEVSSVATGILTTLLTYIVPVGNPISLFIAEVSGTNIADYRVLIDGSRIARQYTYFGGNLNTEFTFQGYKLNAGQIITIEVLQSRPYVGDFSARILGNIQ